MNEMQKSQPSLHNKKPQKHQLKHQKIKTVRTKISEGIDGARKFTAKFTTNSYRRFRSKQTRLAVYDVSKSYVSTTSHKYVAKNELQQRQELNIRTLQTAITCSPSALVPLEQSTNTFSGRNIKQTQFYIWKSSVPALYVFKKNPKTDWKSRR